jgi:signal transduction histidine kinase/ActR/RegA family two-component response regulator
MGRKRMEDQIRDFNCAEHKRAEEQNRRLNIELERRVVESLQLEAQVIEAQKMEVIGKLASGVAHDFNNIIAIIMGYSDMLLALLGPNSPLQKYATEIRYASERAAGLTRQLLVFSRKQAVQPVVLDLDGVVKDLEGMLRRLINENVEMTLLLESQTGRVKADPGYVGQLLLNLVVNARDAMPNGGALTITTKNITLGSEPACAGTPPGDYVALSVSDTGIGMTDEVKAHLFQPFFTTKALGKGTGLGLATCQTIVQQSGGHIAVVSEMGKGTSFTIYLPRVEQALEAVAKPGQTGELPCGTETLMVVEDSPALRHLACGILESQGYAVLSALNGQDALRVAREHQGAPIRLVFTDVVMPLMSGKVMADWLTKAFPDIQILFTSGYPDEVMAQHGVFGKGLEFLPKPYTPATLACKVRELLDAKTAPPHGPSASERRHPPTPQEAT